MLINLEKSTTEIQEEFHQVFPGLNIIFYQKNHENKQGSPVEFEIPSPISIKELNPDCKEGELILDENLSVGQLEKNFEEDFGLYVQVFRRSNDKWLQTITTDNWLLKDQNAKGLHSIVSK